ncbi:tyrosine-type recombinase/integrase [Caloranaerobacter ferrireducens]|uniref:tyrosine-type recombinase/integrase n=1 Tax=Caloranaerobacter ferrireducens TaxID=1323370 RepID=UPI000A66832A|nr:site-specific integrase [Caloranaerobacter ferrireducens]
MRIKMSKNEENRKKTLEEGFKEFYRYCRVKNLSEATLDYYEECYRVFTEFFPSDNRIEVISQKVIYDYIIYLQNQTNCNSISINTRLRGLRVILYYFMKLGYLDEFKIKLIKSEKKVKETYSDKELELLLKKPNMNSCSFAEYRNWVIINYLLGTGNRLSTVVNLKIKDIDFENGLIKIEKSKNRRQQVIPLSKTLERILLEYIKIRRGEPDDYLFCNIYGQKLTTNALSTAIRKYNQKRGVMKTSIHLFRHTFAKKWILAGGDIFRLQKILNHKSLDIVKEYVNMFTDDLQDKFEKFNALEQIKGNSRNKIKIR